MGYMLVLSPCIGCGVGFCCNPNHVPSIRVNGNREPICKACYNRWNQIHRINEGLDPIPLHPDAYAPMDENDNE